MYTFYDLTIECIHSMTFYILYNIYISSDIHYTPMTFEQEFTEYLSVKVNLSDKDTLLFSSIYIEVQIHQQKITKTNVNC